MNSKRWQTILENQGINLDIDYSEYLQKELSIPAGGIIDALERLIENSIEHAFGNIKSPSIKISLINKDNIVLIKFSDNGVGVDLENPNHIFIPYYSTKPRNLTVGLGLSSVKSIVVNQLKGDVYISQSETGLTINIELPKAL
ncbi:ATP-binding protein [Vibrio campbellii]|uniref:histidine kinase n=1 Tax=Vibrio campbellii TaxID=680 RepID=A0AAQ2XY25_9VIBR|nr:ATP-binding protein [Vibrio campbellii]WDG08982.1 ATP-binding protein [Vibrio campbellii]